MFRYRCRQVKSNKNKNKNPQKHRTILWISLPFIDVDYKYHLTQKPLLKQSIEWMMNKQYFVLRFHENTLRCYTSRFGVGVGILVGSFHNFPPQISIICKAMPTVRNAVIGIIPYELLLFHNSSMHELVSHIPHSPFISLSLLFPKHTWCTCNELCRMWYA